MPQGMDLAGFAAAVWVKVPVLLHNEDIYFTVLSYTSAEILGLFIIKYDFWASILGLASFYD